jgi:hypothetical protein
VIADLGTVKIMLDPTDDGTLVYSTTANPLVERMMTYSDGSDETTESGTTTTLDHSDGTVTDDGIVTYEIAESGTVWIKLDGTYDGTAEYEIITADGDDPIETYKGDGSDDTHEIGTTTGLENDVGTTTDDGTYTNDDAGTEVISLEGTDKMRLDPTDDGTLVYSTTANPDEIMIT